MRCNRILVSVVGVLFIFGISGILGESGVSADGISMCVDPDFGFNSATQTIVSFDNVLFQDRCYNVTTLLEYGCGESGVRFDLMSCEQTCWSGTCVVSVRGNDVLEGTTAAYITPEQGTFGFDTSGNERHIYVVGNVTSVIEDGNASAYFFGGYVPLNLSAFSMYPRENNSEDLEKNYTMAFSLWFKTNKSGVLLEQVGNNALPPANGLRGWVPALYIGNDGMLRAQLFFDGIYPGDANIIVGEKPLNDSRWHFVVVSTGERREKVYLDGVLVRTRTFSEVPYASDYSYILGTGFSSLWPAAPQGWFYYHGFMDRITFFNRTLSAVKVAAMFVSESDHTQPKQPIALQPPAVFSPSEGFNGGGVGGGGGGGGGGSYGGDESVVVVSKVNVSLVLNAINVSSNLSLQNESPLQNVTDLVNKKIEENPSSSSFLSLTGNAISSLSQSRFGLVTLLVVILFVAIVLRSRVQKVVLQFVHRFLS